MSSPQTGRIAVVPPSRSAASADAPAGGAGRVGAGRIGAGARAVVRTPEITLGVLGVLVSAAFSWVPSLWYDEGATVTSARRTWAQLWAEIHNVDAVHAFYYALMHLWFDAVGYSPFTLRFPSALAVGVATGFVVALGRVMGGRRVAITAGIVFVLLPRVAWAGTEGRPYAAITAFSACLTMVGVAAVRRSRASSTRKAGRWWVLYAVVAALAIVCNVYLALLVVAHGVALVWTWAASRRAPAPVVGRRTVLTWLVAAAVAALAVLPLVLLVVRQSKQVGWIEGFSTRTLVQVFHTSWFGVSDVYATIAWALMALATVSALVLGRRHAGRDVRWLVRAQAVRVLLPATIVPVGLLVAATAAGEHLYSPKYATLSLPAVALLMALGITTIRPRALLVAAVAAAVVVSLPNAIAVKQPHAKQDTYWAQAASIVAAQRAAHPSAEEGVVYGSVYRHPATTGQIIADAYPQPFAGMRDLLAVTSGAATGELWDRNGDVRTTVPSRLSGIDTVYFVGGTSRNIEPEVASTLASRGFRQSGAWKVGTVVIGEYTR